MGTAQADPRSNPEASLLGALNNIQHGQLDGALNELDALTEAVPTFQLAHLVRGDLLLAKAKGIQALGGGSGQGSLDPLISEVKARIRAAETERDGHYPRALLKIGEQTRYVILVEKSRNRLYVYEKGQGDSPPRLVLERYASHGRALGDKRKRGDLKTPEGVYFIDGFLPDKKLPEKYGIGAFTLNYPNELDRRLSKTGYGIWIHGLERARYSRPPADSEGCVVLPNEDVQLLDRFVTTGATPVVIANEVTWLTEREWRRERDDALAAVEQWRSDWQSLNVDAYLSHYASDFWAEKHNLRSWSQRKRRLAQSKEFQQVTLKNLSLLRYPEGSGDGKQQFVAYFDQDYRSNNYNSTDRKRMYFARDAQRWAIRYEGEG
ncbi:MAG: L,D-transpeptidase family protein [Gammaproteobacteria bacterium]